MTRNTAKALTVLVPAVIVLGVGVWWADRELVAIGAGLLGAPAVAATETKGA